MTSPIKAAEGLIFLGTLLLLTVTLILSHSGFIQEELFTFWICIYLIFAFIILRKLQLGLIYHPLVLVGISYYLLLVIGAVSYLWIKGRPLNLYTFNLIATGFSALMGGIVLGDITGTPKETKHSPEIFNENVVYILAVLGILASLYMFIKFRGVPMLAHNPNEAKVNFLVGNGIFNLFLKGLPVFSLALLYLRFHKRKSLDIAHVYCGIMLLITLAAGYRSSTLISLGQYTALYLILTGKTIPLRVIAVAGVLAIFFLVMVGSYRRGNDGLKGAFAEFEIVINARPVLFEMIVRNFETKDFFNGSLYYNDFKRFLPGLQVNANVDLKYAIFPNAEAMPDIAGVTPSISGEAYMNFGQRGVFWALLIVGFLLGSFYRSFKAKPDFLRTATFLTFAFGMAGGVQSGIGLKLIHLTQFWIWVVLIGIVLENRIFYKVSEA